MHYGVPIVSGVVALFKLATNLNHYGSCIQMTLVLISIFVPMKLSKVKVKQMTSGLRICFRAFVDAF